MKKSKKKNRFKDELKVTFHLIFYDYQEVETLGKNGGASNHTWQLQEKI